MAVFGDGTIPHPDRLPGVEDFLEQDPPEPQESQEPGVFEEIGETLWSAGKTFVLDLGYLLTAPLRPTPEGVFTFVGGAAVVGVTMAVLDEPIRGFAQRNRHQNLDDTLGIIQKGLSYPEATGFGIAGLGLLVGDERLRRTGLEIVETDLFVLLLTGAGKRVFGRSRPYTGRGANSFKFMGGTVDARRSFPSRGAAEAFSIAVPIAEEYPGTIWPYVAYGLATLASIQRIVVDDHWTSDVLTSALLSIVVGKTLVWLHREGVHPPLIPWLATDGGRRTLGLALELRF
jgi:membrane-associated phospholipid phosphatase